ncbi:TetR/AcrR family transcriptional regulator [Pseudonocardia sp. CA-107938]|uniref:TetR/AcrR family transcriptional regulator n=1 Tax=Pseudonocardia sp. CA-107938 TaxID=3240021 RepID=UPI003D8D8601
MPAPPQAPSARRTELLELAYAYVLQHGMGGMSLRPLAEAIGSSPRVLLFLFGSKDGLVQALLERSRADEVALVQQVRDGDGGAAEAAWRIWSWLAAPAHRDLLRLWAEGYGRSLVEPDGAWGGYAQRSVADWLAILGDTGADPVAATAALAVLRGALLDLLATGDEERTTAAVRRALTPLR